MVYFIHSIVKKEELLKDGQLVLFELAPVDPRSLMQGDYMTLRYKISEDIHSEKISKRGYCVIQLNRSGVANRIRFQKDLTPLNKGEYLVEYTSPDHWKINIGAESYFFQEGQAKKFEKAKYGGVKIDKNGNSLLIGLFDEHQQHIE
jgi:uncharacterized membrane-anchored protein